MQYMPQDQESQLDPLLKIRYYLILNNLKKIIYFTCLNRAAFDWKPFLASEFKTTSVVYLKEANYLYKWGFIKCQFFYEVKITLKEYSSLRPTVLSLSKNK